MNTQVTTLAEDATVRDAIKVFLDTGVSGAPVVDPSGRLVGVLSETDIILEQPEEDRAGQYSAVPVRYIPLLEIAQLLGEHADSNSALNPQRLREFLRLPIKEVMTSDPVVCAPANLAVEAAATMVAHQVNRLPVVDVSGTLVGIITRGDVLKSMIWSMLVMDEDEGASG